VVLSVEGKSRSLSEGLEMWIESPPPHKLDVRTQRIYAELADAHGRVDGVMRVHALRPHSLDAHLKLYRSVLHHPANKVPRWLLETIGVLVSRLNGCEYCVVHHSQSLAEVLGDEARAQELLRWVDLPDDMPEGIFSDKECLALAYAGHLTVGPTQIHEDQIAELRGAGWTDGEILEINQAASYFNYVNRSVMGLGVKLEPWRQA